MRHGKFYRLLSNVTDFLMSHTHTPTCPLTPLTSITSATVGTRHLSCSMSPGCISGIGFKWAKKLLPFPFLTPLHMLSKRGTGVPVALSSTYKDGMSGRDERVERQLCLVSDERTNSGRQSPVMW